MNLKVSEELKALLASSKDEPSIFNNDITNIGKIIEISNKKYKRTEQAFEELCRAFREYSIFIKSLNFNLEEFTLKIEYVIRDKSYTFINLLTFVSEVEESELMSFKIAKNPNSLCKFDVVETSNSKNKNSISKIVDEITMTGAYTKSIENVFDEYKELSMYYPNDDKGIKLDETNMYLSIRYDKLILKYLSEENAKNTFSFEVIYNDICGPSIDMKNADSDITNVLGNNVLRKIKSIHVDANSLPSCIQKNILIEKRDKVKRKEFLKSLYGLLPNHLPKKDITEEKSKLKKL